MVVKFSRVLICLAVAFVTASADDLKDTLQKQYEKQVVVLRTAFQEGNQEFDSAGTPLKLPSEKNWIVYGPIYIQKIKVESRDIRLEGPRIAFGRDKKKNKRIAIPLTKPIEVRIHLDRPSNSLSEIQEVLNRVFFPDAEKSPHPVPEYQRPAKAGTSGEPTVYHVKTGEVSVPVPKFTPDPDYSDAARHAKYQGNVTLGIVVDEMGTVSRITIVDALGMGLDEQSVKTLKTWRFEPAVHDGRPVPVEVSVEVSFHVF
jgi:TonB family protein